MGKSDIHSIPVPHQSDSSLISVTSPAVKKMFTLANDDIDDVPFADDIENEAQGNFEPDRIRVLDTQAAGHTFDGKNVGMMKQNGVVLKPVVKKEIGEREIWLYEKLEDTLDKSLIELKNLVPHYYGTKKVTINGKELDCIVLEDLTANFREPCVMDIKIGKRTWGPNATYEKMINEEKKYQDCKRDLGFCIPGFQVYNVSTGKMTKFGKDFGKSLNKERAEDAIRVFLNGENGKFCRRLLVQLLATLWRIQHWARNQRRLRIYSSSILLVYDARRLREMVTNGKAKSPLKLSRQSSLYRPMSMAVLNNGTDRIPTGFSGQLTKEGPILTKIVPASKMVNLEVPVIYSNDNSWQKSIHALKRTHSFQNNYDKDVQTKKQSYNNILADLCSDKKDECWAVAKMIDLAHVFSAENCDIDRNYLEGIDSLVRIFEELLIESE